MIKTVLVAVVAGAFLIAMPVRAEEKPGAPAAEKAEKEKKEKSDKKNDKGAKKDDKGW